MDMASIWVTTATTVASVNVVLLAILGSIWLDNYRQFRTPWVLGLVVFSAVLLLENVVAIYSFFEWGALYADSRFAKLFVNGLRTLQLVALGSMTYVTWQ